MFKGTFIAQIIGFIGAIYLAKIYGSESYGIFSVFISVLGILSIVNTLQLEKSIVILKSKSESKNLMNSLFIMAPIFSLLAAGIYFLYTTFFKIEPLQFEIILLAIFTSILFSFNKIHESFFTYRKKFKPISNAKIYMAIFNFSFQLILFSSFKLKGLVFGNIISIILVTFYYFFKNKNYLSQIDLQQLKSTIISVKSIVKYIFPSTLINNLAINLIPILIVYFFSLKAAGVYFFSLKILATPLFLIASSISQVYYKKSSEMIHSSKEKLFDLTKNIVTTNVVIMLFILVLINTFGIYILEYFLGKNWSNLRLFTFILSFLILARSSFNPISNIIIVLNKNHISLIFNCYLLLVNLIAIFIGHYNNSLTITLICFSVFGSIGYILLLIYFFKKLKVLKNHGANFVI